EWSAYGSKFAAKVIELVEGFGDANASRAAFLTAVDVQKKTAESTGSIHWAPVYERGEAERRAYFVSDYYPRSAQRLIQSRVNLNARTLHRIACAVLSGLQELRKACGRGHGNLKPSNILIDSSASLERANEIGRAS